VALRLRNIGVVDANAAEQDPATAAKLEELAPGHLPATGCPTELVRLARGTSL
jgi:hypothetical protein